MDLENHRNLNPFFSLSIICGCVNTSIFLRLFDWFSLERVRSTLRFSTNLGRTLKNYVWDRVKLKTSELVWLFSLCEVGDGPLSVRHRRREWRRRRRRRRVSRTFQSKSKSSVMLNTNPRFRHWRLRPVLRYWPWPDPKDGICLYFDLLCILRWQKSVLCSVRS